MVKLFFVAVFIIMFGTGVMYPVRLGWLQFPAVVGAIIWCVVNLIALLFRIRKKADD